MSELSMRDIENLKRKARRQEGQIDKQMARLREFVDFRQELKVLMRQCARMDNVPIPLLRKLLKKYT